MHLARGAFFLTVLSITERSVSWLLFSGKICTSREVYFTSREEQTMSRANSDVSGARESMRGAVYGEVVNGLYR